MRAGVCIGLLLSAALSAWSCGDSSTAIQSGLAPRLDGGGAYIAMGDSIAYGVGASDPGTTSYPALISTALGGPGGEELELVQLAVGGHTTQDLIDDQLPEAVERLEEGGVALVTLTIGGNDLFQYSTDPECVRDPEDPGCPLEAGLIDVERRLDQIVSELREAGPEAVVVMEVYPDLFSGSGHVFEYQAGRAFALLNGVISSVARRHDVLLADPRRDFQGRSRELTHIEEDDFHPNDAGYRIIADAFLNALGVATTD